MSKRATFSLDSRLRGNDNTRTFVMQFLIADVGGKDMAYADSAEVSALQNSMEK
jgi:hypothetical protein